MNRSYEKFFALFLRSCLSAIVAIVVWAIAGLWNGWWTRESAIVFVVTFLVAFILLTWLDRVIDREDREAKAELV